MKKSAKLKNCVIIDFVKNNLFVFISGILALIYCCICVVFKASPVYNVSVKLQPWGDFFYNVSISVIAAVIFYIAQVYMPNRKREQVLKDVMKKYCKEVLLKECKMLKAKTDAVRSGEKSENEIIVSIDASCKKVNGALNKALADYLSVFPVELIASINEVLSDDMLYEITIRASGTLVNRSLEQIVEDSLLYNRLWERIDKIKAEVEKL